MQQRFDFRARTHPVAVCGLCAGGGRHAWGNGLLCGYGAGLGCLTPVYLSAAARFLLTSPLVANETRF